MSDVPEQSTGAETPVGADLTAPVTETASTPAETTDAPQAPAEVGQTPADHRASLQAQIDQLDEEQAERDNPVSERPVCERCGQKIPAEAFDHPGVDAWCPVCNQRLPELLAGS